MRKPLPITRFLVQIIGLAILVSLPVVDINAQEEETVPAFSPYLYLNANLQAGLPFQLFKTNGQHESYGGGGLFLVQLGPRPLYAGLEGAMHRFDSEAVNFEEVINGFVEQFEQTTKNNALLAHFVLRIQPWDNSLFRPYLDGLFGTKYFFTRTTIENLETEDTQSNLEQEDWALSYGVALGLQLGFFRNEAVTIDLRCSVLTGNNSTFLARDPNASPPYFAPVEAFWERNAPAAMLIPQIGVTVDLSTVDYY
ncbi:MAG: hypothetical protein R2824_23620 [Saprospiraceae bacterium]|nr:hypothetical protein [Lewinella sp.]